MSNETSLKGGHRSNEVHRIFDEESRYGFGSGANSAVNGQ